jgi:prevent-host-death family protein
MNKTIAQRELRNDNARVIDEVVSGQTFLVTRNGVPVAEIRPVKRPRRTFVPKAEFQALAAAGPHLDATTFRSDLDRIVDQRL